MVSAPVEIHAALNVPPVAARDALMRVMQAVATQSPPYDHLALSLGLRDLHVPIEASLTVPVHATVDLAPLRWECRLDIAALRSQKLFPRFHGTISVTPNGQQACELWLQGSYDPPLGALGAAIDATIFHGAAKDSLSELLAWLVDEITRSVTESERRHEREVRTLHGG